MTGDGHVAGDRGRFVVFEGGEGCGKSTQAALLAERLAAAGRDPVLTRQPGGTTIGVALRALLLDPATADLDVRAEALLMAADRAQHVAEVIRPALAAGRDVVCDRYTYSSIAYQGHGRGLDPTRVREVSAWATDDLWPDLVVLLDVDVATASVRVGDDRDRFEQAGGDFHQRVRDGFLALAAADAERWVVLDGTRAIEDVAHEVWTEVEARR